MYPEIYFQGAAVAWVLLTAAAARLLDGQVKERKVALILFWWSVSDVVEMFFMDRTAFDWNEYITAGITVLIIIGMTNGRRKKRNGPIRRTGY